MLELHAQDVDKVILVVNSAISSGMTWEDISEMVAAETRNGNKIAGLVHKLQLDHNSVILKLPDVDYESDDDEEKNAESSQSSQSLSPCVLVEIDLSLSAHANVATHDGRKQAKYKELRTKEASFKAIESVQDSMAKSLSNRMQSHH